MKKCIQVGVLGFLLLGMAALHGACGKGVYLPTQQELGASGAGDEARLRRGRILTLTQCADCHRLYDTRDYEPEQWEGIVLRMGRLGSLSRSQMDDITYYLSAASRVAPP